MKHYNLKENMVLTNSKNQSCSEVKIVRKTVNSVYVQFNGITMYPITNQEWDNQYEHYTVK